MIRKPKYYPAAERRVNIGNNLQCSLCGNTTAFSIDLRLKHQIDVSDGILTVQLQQTMVERVFDSIARNIWNIIDKAQNEGKEIIRCANCSEAETVDLQERLIEYCWEMGCPGCEVCGNYLPEEDVRELCTECINEHDGKISEDDCLLVCPHYDNSLLQVLEHYRLSLEDLIKELGY